MQAFQLKVLIDVLMRDTGQGSKPIRFLDEEGVVYRITKVAYDEENDVVFLHGVFDEQG